MHAHTHKQTRFIHKSMLTPIATLALLEVKMGPLYRQIGNMNALLLCTKAYPLCLNLTTHNTKTKLRKEVDEAIYLQL